jgi:hypothetical protein
MPYGPGADTNEYGQILSPAAIEFTRYVNMPRPPIPVRKAAFSMAGDRKNLPDNS